MNIYLICPVRNAGRDFTVVDCSDLVARAERMGDRVHYPPRDVDQSDPVGTSICAHHLAAMRQADEVWIVWDSESYGSHFDLGMAYALGKKVHLVQAVRPDVEGKSYLKVIRKWEQ